MGGDRSGADEKAGGPCPRDVTEFAAFRRRLFRWSFTRATDLIAQ